MLSNSVLNKCKSKQVIIPSGIIVVFGLLFPMITANTEGIQENEVEIAKMDITLDNLDNTITKLDNSVEHLDETIVKMKLVICDVSQGKHC